MSIAAKKIIVIDNYSKEFPSQLFTVKSNYKDIFKFSHGNKVFYVKSSKSLLPYFFTNIVNKLNNNDHYNIYSLILNDYGEILTSHNDTYTYVYEEIPGCIINKSPYSFSCVSTCIAELHLSMNKLQRNTCKSNIVSMIKRFLSFDVSELCNGIDRRSYVEFYLSNKMSVLDREVRVIHGDLYNENIIFNNKGVTFIDFDDIKPFYTEYEFMRFFFISLLSVFYESTDTISLFILRYKEYFINYTAKCQHNLCDAFEFYLFVFCLECDIEISLSDNIHLLSFFEKRQHLIVKLLSERNEISNIFKMWSERL